jgi:hypothetical protein
MSTELKIREMSRGWDWASLYSMIEFLAAHGNEALYG